MNKFFAMRIINKYFKHKDTPDYVLENMSVALIKLSGDNRYKEAVDELLVEFPDLDIEQNIAENINNKIN